MTTVLEARAVIRGVDQTGAAFAGVEDNIRKLDRAVGSVAKSIDAVDKIARVVAPVSSRMNAVVEQVNRASAATSGLAVEQQRLNAAMGSLQQYKSAEAALNGARNAFDAATRSAAALSRQIAAGKGAPAELARDYEAAQARVAETSAALSRQSGVAASARLAFEALDGPVASLSTSEDRLRASLARVGQAMAEQGRYSSAASAGAHFLASELERLRVASGRLDTFNALTAGLEKSEAVLMRARANLRAVWLEISAAAEPTRKLQSEYARAEAAVLRATQAFDAQKVGIAEARASFEALAGPLGTASSAQARLAGEIERVNGAMAQQGRVASQSAEQLAVATRKEEVAQRRKAEVMRQITDQLLPFAGPMMLEGVKKSVESAAEVEQLRFRVRELSRKDPSEAPFADSLADEVATKYPAITRGKALDTYLELRANAASEDPNAPIDQAKARSNLMIASKAQTAALALGFAMTPEDNQNLLKAVEGSGRATDPRAVEKISDAYIRAKQVFGSAIASSMLRDYVANAKSANFSIGDDQFYLANMVRMSEGNSARLGNEVNQTMASLAGGAMKAQAGKWFVEHGLATAGQLEKMGGGNVRVRGGLKDAATLQTDQGLWAATTLREAIEAKGALSDANVKARMDLLRADALKHNPTAQLDDRFLRERAEEGLIAADLAKTGLRSTVIDNLAHFVGNQRLIERDVGQLQNASGSDAATRISQNPVAAFEELTNAITNFGSALAGPAIKDVAPLLDGVAHGIANFAATLEAFGNAHPDLAKAGSWATLGLGAAGGGYLTWKLFSGFTSMLTGGGDAKLTGSATALGVSATQLDVAASELQAAAGKLGVSGAANAVEGAGQTAAAEAAATEGGVVGAQAATNAAAQAAAPVGDEGMLAWLARLAPAIGDAMKIGNPLAMFAGLASLDSPEEKAMLDRMIAEESRKAEFGRRGRENAGLLEPVGDLQKALARRALDPDVNAMVDRDYNRRNRNAPEDSPEARRGAAMHDLDRHSELKVSLDPNSRADVSVRVTVDASSELLRAAASATASSSGSLRANVGASTAGVAPNGQGGIGSR